MAVTLVPGGSCTLTGVSLLVVVPSPSCPKLFSPQARSDPPAAAARPAPWPAALAVAVPAAAAPAAVVPAAAAPAAVVPAAAAPAAVVPAPKAGNTRAA